ncbi:MAG: mannose-1-phosphate guanylyltransferase [Myxococcales bacterium]
MSPRLFPLVLAGGSGTRFWPLSRARRPKQLLPLSGREPLVVETAARLRGLARPRDVTIVCGKAHAAAIRGLVPRATVLVEPAARNTAPCVGWAALRVRRVDPAGVLLVLPSDHHVADPEAFRRVLRRCADVAASGALCTVGLAPKRPETGYGYLRVGRPLGRGAFEVAAFVEKPDAKRAARFVERGDHLWNGGIFAFRADAILAEIERQLPALWTVLERLDESLGTSGEAAALRRLFPQAPSVSLDYGVMEGARRVAVVPGDFGWSDLGSFGALPEVREVDGAGNVVEGRAVLVDCRDCVVLARDRPLAVVGMRGAVVVDAGDAVLVVPRERCQDVREVVAELRRRGLQRVL